MPHLPTWKPILGTPYEVSRRGHIRRGGRPLRPYAHPSGYRLVTLCVDGVKYRRLVHRLVLAAFVGQPAGRQSNHKTGRKADNRLANLEYVTAKENRQHAQRLGLHPSHYRRHTHCTHGHALTPDNVRLSRDARGRTFQACRACGRANTRRWEARQ